jgi:predicted AAA+ superfamily ATPase
MKPYLVEPIHQDLKEKMAFLGGPRQVGKTTLALGLIKGANEMHPDHALRLAPSPRRQEEKKLYLWDWSLCQDERVRFESMMASHLLKYCHFIEDTEGDDMSLHFLRDSTGREIDFVINRNGKPAFAVECKTGSHTVSKNIAYFSTRTDIPCYYQVHMGDKDYELTASNTRVIPFTRFCQLLKL